MEKKKLFQYAILFHSKSKDLKKEDCERTELIAEPKYILAINEKVAMMKAIKEIPDKYSEQLEQVEIAIRPF